jgi:lipoprotein-releasing system permease protein
MWVLDQITIKSPFMSGDPVHLPIYRGMEQFAIAFAFAMASSVGASYFPARKGGRLHPVDILRGAA